MFVIITVFYEGIQYLKCCAVQRPVQRVLEKNMSDERRMCQVVIDFIVIHSENLQISICSMLWIPF